MWKSNQAPHAIDATLRLRLLDGVEILRHRCDLSHCLISTQVRERHQRDPAARLSRLTGEVGADAPRSPGGGARRPDGARLHHRGRVRHPVLGPARVVRRSVVFWHLLVVDLDVPGLPRCVVRARRTNQTFTTAAVPSRHRRASSPSSDEVGGLFFDFETIRTASNELATNAREASPASVLISTQVGRRHARVHRVISARGDAAGQRTPADRRRRRRFCGGQPFRDRALRALFWALPTFRESNARRLGESEVFVVADRDLLIGCSGDLRWSCVSTPPDDERHRRDSASCGRRRRFIVLDDAELQSSEGVPVLV